MNKRFHVRRNGTQAMMGSVKLILRKMIIPTAIVVTVLMLSSCADTSQQETAVSGTVESESPLQMQDEQAEVLHNYVALGDSFAAMGGRDKPLRGEPFCLRSTGNYPELISGSVNDVTCQGAVTADLLSPRVTDRGQLPSQIDALNEDTTLVTVSIGGNDLGFGDVASCIRQRIQQLRTGDCVEVLGDDIDQRLLEVPGKLDQVHGQIRARSGEAQVVVTGYLPLLNAVGHCPELDGVSEADRYWAVELTAEINRMAREAANQHGADFVLPKEAGNHTACAPPEQRWVDIRGVDTDAYPMHLTSTGHEAMAAAVRDVLAH